MERTAWVKRKFTFDLPEGWIFNEIERLEGAIPRVKYFLGELSEQQAAVQIDGKWSAKEQVGHLYDLEILHISRLKEIQQRKEVLTPADMQNVLTDQSNHNNTTKEELISKFKGRREEFLEILESLSDDDQRFASLHERLNVKMRPIDVATFTASHDDHHLAYVSSIVKYFQED